MLATGRAFHHARPVAVRLDAPRHPDRQQRAPSSRRAAGTRWPAGRFRGTSPAPLVADTRPFREGAALIFDRPDARQYVYERIDWSHPQRGWYYDRNRVYMTRVEPLEPALDEDPVQIAFTGGVAGMRALADRVRGLPCARRLTVTLTEYEQRDFSLLDVTAEGCSKGAALGDWAVRRRVPRAAIMAVGDNLNDLDMLELAGHPVVMGNAVAELKRCGWPLTTGHDEAGLARAIRDRVLGARPRPGEETVARPPARAVTGAGAVEPRGLRHRRRARQASPAVPPGARPTLR